MLKLLNYLTSLLKDHVLPPKQGSLRFKMAQGIVVCMHYYYTYSYMHYETLLFPRANPTAFAR